MIYERLDPTPPLFANAAVYLLPIFLSAGAFREFKTLDQVLTVRPKPNETYWVLDWEDSIREDPVFPEMLASGPTKKEKNPNSWGSQCSDWALRAGFPSGMGLHAPRREALIKADGKRRMGPRYAGYSLSTIKKFASQVTDSTLGRHYLHDMSNVDGAATFLGLRKKTDLTANFRSVSMGRNPDLLLTLPASMQHDLEMREDYSSLWKEIDSLDSQIRDAESSKISQELRTRQSELYTQRRKIRQQELKKYQASQRRDYDSKTDTHMSDWRRTYFEQVVCHMVPERARLASTLLLAKPLRSPEGISAMQDLLMLLESDSFVGYQDSLRPVDGRCRVQSCSEPMRNIPPGKRWKHVYHCVLKNLRETYGFARFCFLCDGWICNKPNWDQHCQEHVSTINIPVRCDPITFRKGLARAGYCIICLHDESL
ncbi:hypothetical protein BS50DRAFT_507169, partial [Corynespora cassiicola Philippines]